MKDFLLTLSEQGVGLRRDLVEIVQINLGRRCNQACHHCHVEAGPQRTENMNAETVERILNLLAASPEVRIVDLTGGAPELNPHFRRLVTESRRLGKTILDRCNLTVLWEPGQEETAYFFKAHAVQLVASLPCYSSDNVEKQRGQGVFSKSIEALRHLNSLGYGKEGSGLLLDLVYNPGGPFLPPAQQKLEQDYKKELFEKFGILFNRLLTITNMPIRRFLKDLQRRGQYQEYMELLLNSFNVAAARHVMCRNLLSISWDGQLFDCDFNQMLNLPLGRGGRTLWDISSFGDFAGDPITVATHCYGCTAGAGSSCGGALTGVT